MDASQLESYYAADYDVENPILRAEEFDGPDRTLTHGYTFDRNSVHVYLEDGQIHRVIYNYDGDLIDYVSGTEVDSALLVPNKRAYPQYTDATFAHRMREFGTPLTLTTMDEDKRPDDIFKGKRAFELNDVK